MKYVIHIFDGTGTAIQCRCRTIRTARAVFRARAEHAGYFADITDEVSEEPLYRLSVGPRGGVRVTAW